MGCLSITVKKEDYCGCLRLFSPCVLRVTEEGGVPI